MFGELIAANPCVAKRLGLLSESQSCIMIQALKITAAPCREPAIIRMKSKSIPCDPDHCVLVRGARVHNLKNIDIAKP